VVPRAIANRQSESGTLPLISRPALCRFHDKPVPLSGKEYCIFELLSLRKGTVATKQMLFDHLYRGMEEPEVKIIDVFVCHLRKKLAQATGGKHCIETIWGRGYRMRDPGQVPPLPHPCETENDPRRESGQVPHQSRGSSSV
jgi:DNA-binding response OmpR family regulator